MNRIIDSTKTPREIFDMSVTKQGRPKVATKASKKKASKKKTSKKKSKKKKGKKKASKKTAAKAT